jgi:hypothetical protein
LALAPARRTPLLLTALIGRVARAAPDPIAEMRRISELADEALSRMPTDEWLINLIAEHARVTVGAIMADARKYLQKD